MKVYLAGPISGDPEYQKKFTDAQRRWRLAGYTTVNPAEFYKGEKDVPRTKYIRYGILQLLTCDGMVALEGWHASLGASLEVNVAGQSGLKVYEDTLDTEGAGELVEIFSRPITPFTERASASQENPQSSLSVNEEAALLVNGKRQQTYGHPADNWSMTARLWEPILKQKVTPEQAIMCMIQVKLAREMNIHKRDNLVDVAGYAQVCQMVHERNDHITDFGKQHVLGGPSK